MWATWAAERQMGQKDSRDDNAVNAGSERGARGPVLLFFLIYSYYFFIFIYSYFTCVSICLYLCLYTKCVPCTCRGQVKGSDTHTVVSRHAGNQNQVPWKDGHCS